MITSFGGAPQRHHRIFPDLDLRHRCSFSRRSFRRVQLPPLSESPRVLQRLSYLSPATMAGYSCAAAFFKSASRPSASATCGDTAVVCFASMRPPVCQLQSPAHSPTLEAALNWASAKADGEGPRQPGPCLDKGPYRTWPGRRRSEAKRARRPRGCAAPKLGRANHSRRALARGVLKWAAEEQAARRLLVRCVMHLGARQRE